MSVEPDRVLDPVARSNRRRVIDSLRIAGQMARVELTAATGLSPATVSAITADLLRDGVIEETAAEPALSDQEEVRRGRPRVALQLRPEAAYVAGVKISMHQIAVTVTNFTGDLLGSETIEARASRRPAAEVADWLEAALRQGVATAGVRLQDIQGVGMALPGFVDGEAGVCHWSPVFEEPLTPFAELMSVRLGRPVFIDNDANLATLAEHWFGAGKGCSNFLVVTIEHGVGMGAVIGGRLLRGARGFGAEFGHTKIQRSGALCRCGQRGCIEAYLADYAILREASTRAPVEGMSDPVLAHKAWRRLLEAAQAGDEGMREIYARAGEILGVGLANLINVFGPELVTLTGAGVAASPFFEPAMRGALADNTLSASADQVPIIIRPNADSVWAHGAAALVLERLDFPLAKSV